jgi:outer membrane receptor for ferrienterochelin and colicins
MPYTSKKIILFFILLLGFSIASSQNNFEAHVSDAQTNKPLMGVNAVLQGTDIGASADANGLIKIENIPDGTYTIEFSFVGYNILERTFSFPLTIVTPVMISLVPDTQTLQDIEITTTRSTRTIEDIPTRMETIGAEELEEKGNMRPGDIRMILMESTGIQVQQTSPVSGNANFRIQGLDGRYTQLLKDGFPLYSGFAGGLSIMQIPPLDLKRVDIIKGASSTLYGGGAIAGIVNLISKTPTLEPELSFLLNGTSALGLDISGFYSQRINKIGWTIYAAHNRNRDYDPADIGFTAIPRFQRYTINPHLFLYLSDKTLFNLGVNFSDEERLGGDVLYVRGEETTNRFFEKNISQRATTQFGLTHKLNDRQFFTIKNSFNFFNREIAVPDYLFQGNQIASFSEFAYNLNREKSEWVAGLNLWTDNFNENNPDVIGARDYSINTYGAFVQNIWNMGRFFTLESGLRADYVQPAPIADLDGLFILPRMNLMYKPSQEFTLRLGGGMGYKTPVIFSEEAENLAFQNILPLDISQAKAEKSIGGNFDINFRTKLFEEVIFNFNHLFFYTHLDNPSVIALRPDNLYQFINIEGFVSSRGTETNAKFTYDDIKLFIGYTFTDARQHLNNSVDRLPLNSMHRINSVLMFEEDDNYRIGLEAHYFGPQRLTDGGEGKSYVSMGLMVEKIWERFSVYINFENILDARQTRFDTIYTGTRTNPQFRDIYAPLDGRIINGGIKIRLIK